MKMNLTNIVNQHFKLIGLIISLLYVLGLALTIGLNHEVWTDEGHFYKTIIYFTQTPILTSLLHYEEMSTPLPFILYAIWGKIFSVELYSLRIFSLLIAFIFFNISLSFFYSISNNKLTSIILLLILMLNPYIVGISFFVYTDMLATLTLLVSCYAQFKQKYLLSAIFIGLAILSRQYLVYGLISLGVTIVYKELYLNKKIPYQLFYLLIPVIINLALFMYWGGSTPQNLLKNKYMHQAFEFHFDALIAYIACCGIYSSPILLIIFKKIPLKIYVTGLFVGSMLYYYFPIEVSKVTLEAGINVNTIGFFHKLTLYTTTNFQILLWILGITIGLIFSYYLIENTIKNQSAESIYFSTIWIAFLLIMPLSYLTWEKYIIPILPFLLVFAFQNNKTLSTKS